MAENELLSHSDKTFNARLINESEGNSETARLYVSGSGHSKSTVFSVPDPSRIVIDLIGAKIRKNKDYTVRNSALIKSVRFGYHRDKIRIVIDLKENKNIPYRVSESNGKLSLTIENTIKEVPLVQTEKVSKKEIAEKKETPATEPTVVKVKTATPVATISIPTKTIKPQATAISSAEEENSTSEVLIEDLIDKAPAPTRTPVNTRTTPVNTRTSLPTALPVISTPAPAATAAANSQVVVSESLKGVVTKEEVASAENNKTVLPEQTTLPTTQSLKSITFTYSENLKSSPVIKIDLANKTQFELKKADDKLYILTIKDCREFKPELKYVNFPPHDFVGFTYIQAEPENFDINIKIGVERGKRITATPSENMILVSLLQEEKIETNSAPVKKNLPSARPGPSVAR